jgi:hypothetical protein
MILVQEVAILEEGDLAVPGILDGVRKNAQGR